MPTGNSICDASLYEINYKTLTGKTACERDGYAGNCDSKCNNSAEYFAAGKGTGGGGSRPSECRQGAN